MATIDRGFRSNPTTTGSNNPNNFVISGGLNPIVSINAPSNPTAGVIWLNPSNHTIQGWDGLQWTTIPEGGSSGSSGFTKSNTAPLSPNVDDIWLDTNVDEWKIYKSGSWVVFSNSGPSGSGITSVSSDSTITGSGTSGSPLGVANPFTDADETKLDGIETGATADQTAAEIKTSLETLSGNARLSATAIKDLPSGEAITDDAVLDLAKTTRTATDRGKFLGTSSSSENELALLEAPSGGGSSGGSGTPLNFVSASPNNFNDVKTTFVEATTLKITPTSVNSKIKVSFSCGLQTSNVGYFQCVARVQRGSTFQNAIVQGVSNADRSQASGFIIDEPKTTDEVTYSILLQSNNSSGSVFVSFSGIHVTALDLNSGGGSGSSEPTKTLVGQIRMPNSISIETNYANQNEFTNSWSNLASGWSGIRSGGRVGITPPKTVPDGTIVWFELEDDSGNVVGSSSFSGVLSIDGTDRGRNAILIYNNTNSSQSGFVFYKTVRDTINTTGAVIKVYTIVGGGGGSSSSEVPDGSITTAKLADKSVTAPKLGDNAVIASKISNAAVTEQKIADGNIVGTKLADGSVTTDKIVDASVTIPKISRDLSLLVYNSIRTFTTLPAPTKTLYDSGSAVMYRGNLRVIDRATASPAVDGGVSFTPFATGNLPNGFTYRGIVSGVGLLDVPNPSANQVVYYVDTHSFYFYDDTTLILGQKLGWTPIDVPNYIGFSNSLADAVNRVNGNGQVIYRSDISQVEVSFSYRPSTPALYKYLWKPIHDIQNLQSIIIDNSEASKANKTAIDTNTTDIATNKTAIDTNATDIATNKTAIAANATAIEDLSGKIENVSQSIEVIPAFAVSGAFEGNYTLVIHGLDASENVGTTKLRILATGQIVHEEAWTPSNTKRTFAFNINTTEAGNISRNLRSRTSISIQVLFLNSSDATISRSEIYEWQVVSAAPSSGLTTTQVDARVKALVADQAETGNASVWPLAKIPTITDAKLGTNTISGDRIRNASLNGNDKLTNSSVTSVKLGSNSVTTSKIADNAVTTGKIPNNNITDAKIQSVSSSKLSGTISEAIIPSTIARDTEVTAAISAVRQVPSGGTTGQVVKKTDGGYGWGTDETGTSSRGGFSGKLTVVEIPSGASSISLGIENVGSTPNNIRPNGALSSGTYYLDYRDFANKRFVFSSGSGNINTNLAELIQIAAEGYRDEFLEAGISYFQNNKSSGNLTFSGGGIADIRPTSSEGGATVTPGYAGVVSLRASGTNRYALSVNAFKRTPTAGLSQSQVDARILAQARAGNTAAWPLSKIPTGITRGTFTIQSITQSAYDALSSKVATTIYLITG